MTKENEPDSTFRTGAGFVFVGILVIAVIWYYFLRPADDRFEQPETIPITTINANATIFDLVPGESRVRFTIDELLRGQPKTVVGETGLVSGQFALDLADLATARVGVIKINARSFYTDDVFRDEGLHSFIIDSPNFPLVSFTPSGIDGLPERIAVGETAGFTINGDLTIRDITQSVLFECTAVPISPTRLEGRATATINRADFDLVIPEVPQVAAVDEALGIEIEFVAMAVSIESR